MLSGTPVDGPRPAMVVGLLISTWATSAFGNSLQSISVLAWLQPFVLLLTYEGAVRSFRSTALAHACVLLVQALGFLFAFSGALSFPTTTYGSIAATLGLGTALCALTTFGALLPALLLRRLSADLLPPRSALPASPHAAPRASSSNPSLSPLGWLVLVLPLWSYPVLHSALYTLTGFLAGHWHELGVAVTDWPPIAQLASLFGLWGINFMVDLASAVAYVVCTLERLPLEPIPEDDDAGPEAAGVSRGSGGGGSSVATAADGGHAGWSRLCRPLRRHVIAVGVALWVLTVVGGGLVYQGAFYQRPVQERLVREQRLPVSCLVMEDADVGSGDYVWLWQKTAERVAAGDRIVLWSEEAVGLKDDAEELALLTAARDLLATHGSPGGPAGPVGTYLGLCYRKSVSNNTKSTNHFALMDPNGTVVWNYRKAFPVPVVEAQVVAGPAHLPTAPSPYGVLGGAICFDMDRPLFLRQAGAAHVDLLLQPSWTWGAVGPRHFASNVLRALENGFTTLRCSSSGVSGTVSPRGVVSHYLLTGSRDLLTFVLPLPPRVRTVYAAGGWVLEWVNLAVAGLLLALLAVPRSRLTRWVVAGRGEGGGEDGGGDISYADGREALLHS